MAKSFNESGIQCFYKLSNFVPYSGSRGKIPFFHRLCLILDMFKFLLDSKVSIQTMFLQHPNSMKVYYSRYTTLMGEGFILLTRGYGFMGGVPPPFDTLKICTSTYDMLQIYR